VTAGHKVGRTLDKEEQLGGRKGKKRREEEKKERDEVFLD
jgi:hypothetical protein